MNHSLSQIPILIQHYYTIPKSTLKCAEGSNSDNLGRSVESIRINFLWTLHFSRSPIGIGLNSPGFISHGALFADTRASRFDWNAAQLYFISTTWDLLFLLHFNLLQNEMSRRHMDVIIVGLIIWWKLMAKAIKQSGKLSLEIASTIVWAFLVICWCSWWPREPV